MREGKTHQRAVCSGNCHADQNSHAGRERIFAVGIKAGSGPRLVAAKTMPGWGRGIFQADGDGWNFERIGSTEGGRLLASRAFSTNTVLCSNDRLAIGMLSAAYGLGLRVGHGADCDLRIAGHDDHPFSRFTCPPLTTIAQDYEAIANRAVSELFEMLENKTRLGTRTETCFEGRLIMRESA